MLKVYENLNWNDKGVIYNHSDVFEIEKENEWFKDPFVERIVREIDKTEHIKDDVFNSPILGYITSSRLSGGTKALILAYKLLESDEYIPTSKFGDNCWGLLGEIGKKKDVNLYENWVPPFKTGECELQFENGVIVDNVQDFLTQKGINNND